MEQRLIDANVLKNTITKHSYIVRDRINSTGEGMFTVGIMQAIDEQPTIDAVPVRHGRWMPREEGMVYPFWERYPCSECGEHSDDKRYCPNCGARMDKDV